MMPCDLQILSALLVSLLHGTLVYIAHETMCFADTECSRIDGKNELCQPRGNQLFSKDIALDQTPA